MSWIAFFESVLVQNSKLPIDKSAISKYTDKQYTSLTKNKRSLCAIKDNFSFNVQKNNKTERLHFCQVFEILAHIG